MEPWNNQLSREQRATLESAAARGATDEELLRMLWDAVPSGFRHLTNYTQLLHNELGVPYRESGAWVRQWRRNPREDTRFATLADRCWRWIHRALRQSEPRERIDEITGEQRQTLTAMGDEVEALRLRPRVRSREKFEAALARLYDLNGRPHPRVLWFGSAPAARLFVAMCRGQGFAEFAHVARQVLDRRFSPPDGTPLGSAVAAMLSVVRDFMPAAYSAELPKYLNFQTLGEPVMRAMIDDGFIKDARRLGPVATRTVTLKLEGFVGRDLHRRPSLDALNATPALAWGAMFGQLSGLAETTRDLDGVLWPAFAHYAAAARFYRHVGADPVPGLALRQNLLEELCREGYWSWLGENVVVCGEGPTVAHYDDEQRLHNATGPALEFADGFVVYAMQGFLVPPEAVTNPAAITLAQIESERNADVRRILTEVFGHGRYLKESGAELVHMDQVDVVPGNPAFGSMPRALLRDKRGQRWLVGTDGSTHRVYYMRVPDDVETCEQAHSALAGFSEENIIASS